MMEAYNNGPGAVREGDTKRQGGPGAATETTHASQVAALRAALRDQAGSEPKKQRAVDKAAAPLIARYSGRLLHLCRKLTRGAPHAALEAEDLALLAWQKVLRYLAGPCGDHVKDDLHCGRLLMTAARSCLLDALGQCARENVIELDRPLGEEGFSPTRAELLADPRATAEAQLLPGDSVYLKLVEALFTDEECFNRTYRQHNQRRPRNYQALVLYQIGEHWRDEVGQTLVEDPRRAALLRHYVALLGIPAALWACVEKAAMAPEPEPQSSHAAGLLAAVNAVCGTNLRDQATLKVLRHEMNKFASQTASSSGPS
jgi:hypothetical protein